MSQAHNSTPKFNETPNTRQRKRFARRWKRRIRILSPFLGIPLIFCALALSMDFVKYLPQAQAAQAQARHVKSRSLVELHSSADRRAQTPARPLAATRLGDPIQPNIAPIDQLDPNAISLEITNSKIGSLQIRKNAFGERSTR